MIIRRYILLESIEQTGMFILQEGHLKLAHFYESEEQMGRVSLGVDLLSLSYHLSVKDIKIYSSVEAIKGLKDLVMLLEKSKRCFFNDLDYKTILKEAKRVAKQLR